LRRLSWGVRLILLAILAGVSWPFVTAAAHARITVAFAGTGPWAYAFYYHSIWIGGDVAALLLIAAVFLLTTPEGYPPADRADRTRRLLLRGSTVLPLLALWILHVATQLQLNEFVRTGSASGVDDLLRTWGFAAFLLGTVGVTPLPILLYLQLRSLAKRARSAHLAEHCVIVGAGNTLTLLYIPAYAVVQEYGARGAMGEHWYERSNVFMGMTLAAFVVALLFGLWNLYLLLRFAVAFMAASRTLRRSWREADRSAGVVSA
jgi:hypothetical protein